MQREATMMFYLLMYFMLVNTWSCFSLGLGRQGESREKCHLALFGMSQTLDRRGFSSSTQGSATVALARYQPCLLSCSLVVFSPEAV